MTKGSVKGLEENHMELLEVSVRALDFAKIWHEKQELASEDKVVCRSRGHLFSESPT